VLYIVHAKQVLGVAASFPALLLQTLRAPSAPSCVLNNTPDKKRKLSLTARERAEPISV
jgi:hypothetical protein